MDDPRDRRVAFLVERIPGQLARIEQLLDGGNRLHAKRIVGVIEVDQAEVVRRDGCAVQLEDVREPRVGHVVEFEEAGQILQGGDAVFLLPLPVVPLLVRNIGIEPTPIET